MNNKLNNKEIELYQKLSGIIIDTGKSATDKQGRYWTVTKNKYGKWRSYDEIMQYIMVKTNKLSNNNHNKLHNKSNNNSNNNINNQFHVNRHNVVEFIQGGKVRRLCLNLTLTPTEFQKLQGIAKKHNLTWSSVGTQIVKSYLKGE